MILFLCSTAFVAAFDQCVHCQEDIEGGNSGARCHDCNGVIHIRCQVSRCPASASGQMQLRYNNLGNIIAISAGVPALLLVIHQFATSATSSIEGAGNTIGGAIGHTANNIQYGVGDRVSQSIERAGSDIANSIVRTGRNFGLAVLLSSILFALKRIR